MIDNFTKNAGETIEKQKFNYLQRINFLNFFNIQIENQVKVKQMMKNNLSIGFSQTFQNLQISKEVVDNLLQFLLKDLSEDSTISFMSKRDSKIC